MKPTPNLQVLLVEGHDDKKVVEHLLRCKDLNYPFKIENTGGFSDLRKSIPAHIKRSGVKAVGILADANSDLRSRWQSISDQLKKAHCQSPNCPAIGGRVFSGPSDCRIGVWLMPDNQVKGELEDFVYGLIPCNDPVLPRAKDYIDSIPDKDRKFKDKKLVRAYTHAWLAAREKPRPMGLAIKAGDLDKDATGAAQFVDWLRELFQF